MEFNKKLISNAITEIAAYLRTVTQGRVTVKKELVEIKTLNTPAVIIYVDSIEPSGRYANDSLSVNVELLVLVGDESPSSRLECSDMATFLVQQLHGEYIPFNGAKNLIDVQDATPVETQLDSEQFSIWRINLSFELNNMPKLEVV